MGFGELNTSGRRFSNEFEIRLADDPLGWKGQSPLFVTFRAPTWMLLLEPSTAVISFGV
ncbi:Uu.00g027780.m01.CDS01, partial [Anthostomella pinea]